MFADPDRPCPRPPDLVCRLPRPVVSLTLPATSSAAFMILSSRTHRRRSSPLVSTIDRFPPDRTSHPFPGLRCGFSPDCGQIDAADRVTTTTAPVRSHSADRIPGRARYWLSDRTSLHAAQVRSVNRGATRPPLAGYPGKGEEPGTPAPYRDRRSANPFANTSVSARRPSRSIELVGRSPF